jgi:hypothetical protein
MCKVQVFSRQKNTDRPIGLTFIKRQKEGKDMPDSFDPQEWIEKYKTAQQKLTNLTAAPFSLNGSYNEYVSALYKAHEEVSRIEKVFHDNNSDLFWSNISKSALYLLDRG